MDAKVRDGIQIRKHGTVSRCPLLCTCTNFRRKNGTSSAPHFVLLLILRERCSIQPKLSMICTIRVETRALSADAHVLRSSRTYQPLNLENPESTHTKRVLLPASSLISFTFSLHHLRIFHRGCAKRCPERSHSHCTGVLGVPCSVRDLRVLKNCLRGERRQWVLRRIRMGETECKKRKCQYCFIRNENF